MKKVPHSTIERLVIYYRCLKKLLKYEQEDVISSLKLGERVGVSAAQVRKDLSYFGEFGCKGVGYEIKSLKQCLEKILGFNQQWPIVLVGAGNLGRALVNYHNFKDMGFNIVEVFDNDLNIIGHKVGELTVKSIKEMDKIIKSKQIKLAIIATPAEEAQRVGEKLVNVGIKAIWNFAPHPLKLGKDVIVYYEDLGSALVTLTYMLEHEKENKIDEKVLNL